MMLQHTNTVTPENGPRPAGMPDRCFYCGEPVGAEHKTDCVCRVKVVMVEVTMTVPRVVPASWDAGMVDFHMNDGAWCADNITTDLNRYMEARGEDSPCLCNTFHSKFLRDATDDDLQDVDLVCLSEGR